jgi:hypothetical protein
MQLSETYVAELLAAAKVAHEKFSDAHAKHAEAETELGKAASIRARLVSDLDDARKALRDARRLAITSAITRDGFSEASARVAALENEAELLECALKSFHANQYMENLRGLLSAQLFMLEQQHTSERARRAHHAASIQLGLSAIAAENGGHLEVQMNGAVRGFEELIAKIGRDVFEAREALTNHDAETRALRNELGEV